MVGVVAAWREVVDAAVGTHEAVAETKADELMVVTSVFDHEARKRSYEILNELFPGRAARE